MLDLPHCYYSSYKDGLQIMIAYEFYWRDEIGKEHLVGILPERRKNSLRITKESILNWVWLVIGDNLEGNSVYFVQVEL